MKQLQVTTFNMSERTQSVDLYDIESGDLLTEVALFCDMDSVEHLKQRIKEGNWIGGQWIMGNDQLIFKSDVSDDVFEIVEV
jgi:hypothetical protein